MGKFLQWLVDYYEKTIRNKIIDYGLLVSQLTIVIDGCSPNPCKNGGICLGTVDRYKCKCVGDFVGKNCESKFPVILYNVKGVKLKEDL